MKEQIIKDLMEAVHDIAKVKGENEALRNENKFLRELLTKQLNILPVSGSLPSENQINNKAIEFSNKRYYKENNPHDTTINDFKAGVQWLLGYMAGNDR
jgi:hypothetical protein